jgi:hypothetical protein
MQHIHRMLSYAKYFVCQSYLLLQCTALPIAAVLATSAGRVACSSARSRQTLVAMCNVHIHTHCYDVFLMSYSSCVHCSSSVL